MRGGAGNTCVHSHLPLQLIGSVGSRRAPTITTTTITITITITISVRVGTITLLKKGENKSMMCRYSSSLTRDV